MSGGDPIDLNNQEAPPNEDEGARPSSLMPVHKLAMPDVHYDIQLLRDLERTNTRTRDELGPLPPGGLAVQVKRKPNVSTVTRPLRGPALHMVAEPSSKIYSSTTVPHGPQEPDEMKFKALAMAAAFGAAVLESGSADAGQHDAKYPTTPAALNRKIPKEFHSYLSRSVGDGRNCVVGKVTDEDGMYARPYVYLAKATGGRVQWARFLDMPKNYYEGRATHCLRSGDDIYVLLQLDTQAPRSLSQTLLSIVKVRMNDGATAGGANVPVPDAHGAYTSWVWDDDGFKRVGDAFLVTGKYRYMDTEDDLPFSASIKM
jgi:hypothetical protein